MKLTGAQIRDYTREYQRLVDKYANEGIIVHTRERIAKDMGLSVQQADRYKKMNSLISDIQDLVFSEILGMSSSFPIATHFEWEQREIKEILFDAISENVKITRTMTKHIIDEYRSGKRLWSEIKSTYVQPIDRTVKAQVNNIEANHPEVSLESVRNLKGRGFVLWFAELLKNIGYSGISIVDGSHDEGADIIAQKEGINYCFQCKNRKSAVRIGAFQEVFYGKPANCNIPVVVSAGRITKDAIHSGAKRGIQAWDGAHLETLIRTVNGDES